MAKRNTLIPLKDKIKVLVDSYERLEAYIRNQLFSILRYDKNQINRIKKNVYGRIENQDSFNLMWGTDFIIKGYNESASIAKAKLEKIDLKQKLENFDQIAAKSKKKGIASLVFRYMGFTNREIKNKVRLFFMLLIKSQGTLQIQNKDALWWSGEINEEVQEIKEWSLTPATRLTKAGFEYSAVPTRVEIQKRLKETFEETFGEFDFIQVPLKKGGFRNYKPDVYLEMVARTEGRKVQTQAVLDRMKEYDNDLMQVSSHNNPCPICVPFEGQIYSASGNSKTYPPLDDAPPFHPNCEHVIFPTSGPVIKANLKNPRVPRPPPPAWGLTVEKQLGILKKARQAARAVA